MAAEAAASSMLATPEESQPGRCDRKRNNFTVIMVLVDALLSLDGRLSRTSRHYYSIY